MDHEFWPTGRAPTMQLKIPYHGSSELDILKLCIFSTPRASDICHLET